MIRILLVLIAAGTLATSIADTAYAQQLVQWLRAVVPGSHRHAEAVVQHFGYVVRVDAIENEADKSCAMLRRRAEDTQAIDLPEPDTEPEPESEPEPPARRGRGRGRWKWPPEETP